MLTRSPYAVPQEFPPLQLLSFGNQPTRPSTASTTPLQQISTENLVNTFTTYAQISSPSGFEEPMRQQFISDLQQLQITPENVNDNVIFRVPSNQPGSQPTILITGHLDTVRPCDQVQVVDRGQGENRTLHSDSTTILGGDNKAALASMMECLRLLQKNPDYPRPNLLFVITRQEETGGQGIADVPAYLYKDVDLALAFDTQGPPSQVIHTAPALQRHEFTLKGRAAHSGMNARDGINALNPFARTVVDMPLGQLDDHSTANIGGIQSTATSNTIPGEITALYETRSTQPNRVDEESQRLHNTLNLAVKAYPGTTYSTRLHSSRPFYNTSMSEPVVQTLKQAYETLNLPFQVIANNGLSDINNIAGSEHPVPGLVLGGGYYNPHQTNEYVKVQDMVDMTRVMLQLSKTFSQQKA